MKKVMQITPFLTIYRPRNASMLSIFQRISGVVLTIVGVCVLLCKKQSILFGSYYLVYQIIFFFVKSCTLSISICLVGILLVFCVHLCLGIRYVYWERTGGFHKYPYLIEITKYNWLEYVILYLSGVLLFQGIWIYILI